MMANGQAPRALGSLPIGSVHDGESGDMAEGMQIQTGSPDPVEVTEEHRETSAAVMRELCTEVSSPHVADRALHVRVGHYQQAGFLSPRLFGFWVLPVLPEPEQSRPIAGLDELGLDWAEQAMRDFAAPGEISRLVEGQGVVLQTPNASTPGSPSSWACVLNASIEAQVESTLTAMAMLIARQELVVKARERQVVTLPERAAAVDSETMKAVGDDVRINGWRSAAAGIRARAEAAHCSLSVEYVQPLFETSDLHKRMPVARHVYNTFPGAREAIDRLAHTMTSGWSIVGPGPERVLQRARDSLEGSGVISLTALAIRDAFVCGVGAVSLGAVPLGDPWLLRPEEVVEIAAAGDTVRRLVPGGLEALHPVLAMRGGTQIGSSMGVSMLEPLVLRAANRDLFLRVLLSARAIHALGDGPPQEARGWARESEMLATGQLASLTNANDVFNRVVVDLPAPDAELYGGRDRNMEPAAPSLALGQ